MVFGYVLFFLLLTPLCFVANCGRWVGKPASVEEHQTEGEGAGERANCRVWDNGSVRGGSQPLGKPGLLRIHSVYHIQEKCSEERANNGSSFLQS